MNVNGKTPERRNVGLDLARIVFMFLIVLRHGTFQSGATAQEAVLKANYLLGVAINDVTATAVNGFVLISAYFLCQQPFRFGRLVRLWIGIAFYSLVVLAVATVIGLPLTPRQVIGGFLPISMGTYWFMSKYFLLVALSPFLNRVLMTLESRSFLALLGVLLVAYSLLPSVGIDTFSTGHGYSIGWFVVLYATAAYLRRFGGEWTKLRSAAGYAVATAATFAWLGARFALKKQGVVLVAPDDYDFLPTYLASVFLFRFFAAVEVRPCALRRAVSWLAPLTLGVYLFHDNVLKHVLWRDVLGIDRLSGSPFWCLGVLSCVTAVYAAGILVEAVRKRAFSWLEGRFLPEVGNP